MCLKPALIIHHSHFFSKILLTHWLPNQFNNHSITLEVMFLRSTLEIQSNCLNTSRNDPGCYLQDPSTPHPQISIVSDKSQTISSQYNRTQVSQRVSKSHFWFLANFLKPSVIWLAQTLLQQLQIPTAKPGWSPVKQSWLPAGPSSREPKLMEQRGGLLICSNLGGEDELGEHQDKEVREEHSTVATCNFMNIIGRVMTRDKITSMSLLWAYQKIMVSV